MDEEWQPRSPRRDMRVAAFVALAFGLVVGGAGLATSDGSLRWVWLAGIAMSVVTAWRWFQRSRQE